MNAEELTAALGGKWNGSSGIARCPAHDDRTPSLSIGIGASGKLLLHCFGGCGQHRVIDALRRQGYLQGKQQTRPASAAESEDHAALDAYCGRARNRETKRIADAQRIASELEPLAGTPGEKYLAKRGISGDFASQPVGWHPAKHAVVFVAKDIDGDARAVQCVFLTPKGDKRLVRTTMGRETAKLTTGVLKGAAVRFGAGIGGAEVIAEGPETGASIWATTGRPTSVCLGPVRADVPLDDGAEAIIAAEQGKHYSEVAADLTDLGHPVFIATPPEPHDKEGWDFNDALLRDGPEAVNGAIDNAAFFDREPRPGFGEGSPSEPSWPSPLGDAAFIGLPGEFVRLVEPETEADAAALLMQLLAASGNCAGRDPFFEVEGARHGANLYVTLVGATSKSRKGTSLRHVMNLFKRVDPEWAAACAKSGASSGEGLIWHVRDERGDDPGVADKRLLLLEDEFATILRRMEREGNSLSAIMRQAWDGLSLCSLTKNSPATATHPHVSIISHVTVVELRRYLLRTEIASGFANRFLFGCVRRSKHLPNGGSVPADAMDKLAAKFQRVLARGRSHLLEVAGAGWTAGAAARWARVYYQLSDDRDGMFGAVTARAEAQVRRLALLYNILDPYSHDPNHPITRAHLDAALEVWRYCEESARYIFGNALGDPTADAVLRALTDAGAEGLSRTDLYRTLGRHSGDAAKLDAALASLERTNRIVTEKVATRGRPESRLRINWT